MIWVIGVYSEVKINLGLHYLRHGCLSNIFHVLFKVFLVPKVLLVLKGPADVKGNEVKLDQKDPQVQQDYPAKTDKSDPQDPVVLTDKMVFQVALVPKVPWVPKVSKEFLAKPVPGEFLDLRANPAPEVSLLYPSLYLLISTLGHYQLTLQN